MAYERIRTFNKRFINPLFLTIAGSLPTPFARLRHVGRRSGKPYEIPIIVEPLGNAFVIALTYGSKVDWYRNVVANGQATLRWHSGTYALAKPEPIDRTTALRTFGLPFRLILDRRSALQFVQMHVIGAVPALARPHETQQQS